MAAVAAALPVDAARVLAERDGILAADEFNPQVDWRTRLMEWFGERLEGIGAWLPLGLRALGLLLALAAIAVAIAWLLPGRRAGGAPGVAAAARAGAGPVAGFAGLRADALLALGQGRLADVARFSWLAALALLDQAGVSLARAACADWEHVAAARRQRPELAGPLADLALEFQRARFGHAALERGQADRCLALLGALERGLRV